MVYATREGLERILAEIPNSTNRDLVRTFLEEKEANGAKLQTLVNHANHLRAWGVFLDGTTFSAATREDVRKFVNHRTVQRKFQPKGAQAATVREVTLSVSTVNIRKTLLRAFQRWVHGGDSNSPFPPEVAWLQKTRQLDADTMPVEAVLTRDELHALIERQLHPQHRAIFATLYDSGMRASEFVSLRLRNVTIDEYGAVLTLPKGGDHLKTGARRVRLLNATPYLISWLNVHPAKDNANSALWLSMSRRDPRAPLTANALYTMVKREGERAGFDKEIWPHLFRHSRATEAAKESWSEAEMRVYFGWTRNSDMPSRYIHLSGRDVEENQLRRMGKLDGARTHRPNLMPHRCRCGHENSATALYCERPDCGKPLTIEAVERKENAHYNALLTALEGDSDAMQRLAIAIMQRAQAVQAD